MRKQTGWAEGLTLITLPVDSTCHGSWLWTLELNAEAAPATEIFEIKNILFVEPPRNGLCDMRLHTG